METYCGYIALLGRPNAGKSTLLNACIGQKIVGVSDRPQTTRNRVLGVITEEPYQLIFLDSPGLHKSQGLAKLNQSMNKLAWSVAAEADIICYLIDSLHGWHAEDGLYLNSLLASSTASILVLASKSDAAKMVRVQENVQQMVEQLKELAANSSSTKPRFNVEPLIISAKRQDSVKQFKNKLAALLPASPWLFAPDELTDKPERFVVAELIREQLFRHLGDELPYGCGVHVDRLTSGKTVSIYGTIIVTRPSHKPMVIGKKGELIKTIGIKARESLERHFGQKVFLELYVKIEPDWVNKPNLIATFQDIEES